MNTATTSPRVIVGAPGQLLPYLANMDKLAAQMRAQAQAINNAMKNSNRALQFLMKQYEQSAIAKKRKAKQNLTAARNAALVNVRRTLRELVAIFIEHTTAPCLQLRELLSEQHQANAPNRCTVKNFASLRQELQTTKAGTNNRF
jgi:hypothetical protein